MARIAGVDLPREKRVEIGLTSVSYTHLTLGYKTRATHNRSDKFIVKRRNQK